MILLSSGVHAFSDIFVNEAYDLLNADPTIYLLDVRTQSEYESGHIGGAYLIPYTEVTGRAGELPSDKATFILVYCRSGVRSVFASGAISDLGYRNVSNMLGGFNAWLSKGYPYITGPERGTFPVGETPLLIVVVCLLALVYGTLARKKGVPAYL